VTGEAWAIIGILVTLVVGIPALFMAKKVWSNRQQQNVRGGGSAYQAGRDISIGDK
jgi:hypothetical protein